MVKCMDLEPKPTRLLAGVNRHELLKKESEGREVLVIFVNGNPDEPVIIGMFENVLENLVCMDFENPQPEENKPIETFVDGKHMITAENELILTCGKGSIIIEKDGKIILKGTEILSRASGANKIKGSIVELN